MQSMLRNKSKFKHKIQYKHNQNSNRLLIKKASLRLKMRAMLQMLNNKTIIIQIIKVKEVVMPIKMVIMAITMLREVVHH